MQLKRLRIKGLINDQSWTFLPPWFGRRCKTWLSISLKEGRNREVRKVMAHIGMQVTRLIRVAYGPFQLGTLPRGAVDEVAPKVLREQMPADG